MIRLSHPVVTDDVAADGDLMVRVAREVRAEPVPGLPKVMLAALAMCVEFVITERNLVDYLTMCMLVAQARPGGEPDEKIYLRQDLVELFYALYLGDS